MAFQLGPFSRAVCHICGYLEYVDKKINLATKWVRSRTTKSKVAKQDVKHPGHREEGCDCGDERE
jgi:hypothetical protein